MIVLITLVFLAVLAFEHLLAVLNMKQMRKKSRLFPNWLMGYSTPQEFRKSADYSCSRGRVALISELLSSLIFFQLLIFGLLGRFEALLLAKVESAFWSGFLFLAGVSLMGGALSLPFNLYKEFKVEKRYGFSRYTLRLYFSDILKQLLIGGVLFSLLYTGIFYLLSFSGPLWWLWSFLLITSFSLVISLLYPVLIAPLFNRFRPMEDGELKDAISAVAKEIDFSMEGIYVMDGSRRSSHQNAYFTGFGRMRRIVLFDTLVESLSVEELTAVTAHEMGHWKKRHIISNLSLSMLSNFILFFAVGYLMRSDSLFTPFGFQGASLHALVAVLVFCLEPILAFLRPFMNFLSRKHEFEADEFAVEVLGGDPKPMMSSLLKLSRDNLSLAIPHRLYAFWNFSHPALQERLSALSKLKGGK